MALKFQFKRGVKTKLPALAPGEPGFTTDEGKLYVGTGSGNVEMARGDHGHTAAQVGAVPSTRKVNGKALSADVTLSAADVGAFGMGTQLSTGDDLDGYSLLEARIVSGDVRNRPPASSVYGVVWTITGDYAGHLIQFYMDAAVLTIFHRMRINGVWGPWAKEYDSFNKPSALEIGATTTFGPVTVTVTTSWAGAGPWTQTVGVTGVLASDNGLGVYPVDVADAAARKLYEKAYGCLAAEVDTVNGGLRLICRDAKPETAFQIVVKGVR